MELPLVPIPPGTKVLNPSGSGLQRFRALGTDFVEDNFSTNQGWGTWLRMIQMHYIYCALYF